MMCERLAAAQAACLDASRPQVRPCLAAGSDCIRAGMICSWHPIPVLACRRP